MQDTTSAPVGSPITTLVSPSARNSRLAQIGHETSEHKIYYQRYYNNANLSDVYIRFGDKIFAAHKIVLGFSSKVSDAAWKTDAMDVPVYRIKGYSDSTIIAMLQYIYEYPLLLDPDFSPEERIDFLIKLYVLADEHKVGRLEDDIAAMVCQILKSLNTTNETEKEEFVMTVQKIYNVLVSSVSTFGCDKMVDAVAEPCKLKGLVEFDIGFFEALERDLLDLDLDRPDMALPGGI